VAATGSQGQRREKCVSVDDFASPGNVRVPDTVLPVVALPPAGHGVALWWVALERAPEEAARLAAHLSAEEHARALRFGTEALRQHWIIGRATLRMLLGRVLGVAPSKVALARGRRGRPVLATADAPDFNVSHTRDVALVGIGDRLPQGTRIGVDIEHGDRAVNADRLARKFLTASERTHLLALPDDERRRRFLRLWTCKEAMSKATGEALAAPFGRLDVAVDGPLTLAGGPEPYTPADWALHRIPLPDGYLATLAVWRAA
jgi:4'-phosphopantetheinyl transferase